MKNFHCNVHYRIHTVRKCYCSTMKNGIWNWASTCINSLRGSVQTNVLETLCTISPLLSFHRPSFALYTLLSVLSIQKVKKWKYNNKKRKESEKKAEISFSIRANAMFWPVISGVCGDVGHTLCTIDYYGVTYLLMLVRTGNKNGRDRICYDRVCLYSVSPADVRNPFSVICCAFEFVLRVSCVLHTHARKHKIRSNKNMPLIIHYNWKSRSWYLFCEKMWLFHKCVNL
jgi:hypothetical protein